MVPYNKPPESADALVALRSIYYSRFPRLDCPSRTHHSQRRLTPENKGVAENDYLQTADSKLIGRQAFLLDEPLRQVHDGKLLRRPLENTKCHDDSAHSREESTLWGIKDDKLLSECGRRLDWQREDLEARPKYQRAQGMVLWLSPQPEVELTGVENISTINTLVATLQDQQPVGEPHSEALAEELYRRYINEAQCCELGGWLSGSRNGSGGFPAPFFKEMGQVEGE